MRIKSSFLTILIITFFIIAFGCSNTNQELNWYSSIDRAITIAKNTDRPILIEFYATWCQYCRALEDSTFTDSRVKDYLRKFVLVRINVDEKPEIANQMNANARKYGGVGIPNILFLRYDRSKIKHVIGYMTPKRLCSVMDTVLTEYNKVH